ncbi:hypothetical protein U9M48_019984, partial [Paspalum notatum var. saurae]
MVTGKWIFLHKLNSDGTIAIMLVGFSVASRIILTFSPVVKPTTIHTVLSLDLSNNRPVHQLDVKKAFLHGILSETLTLTPFVSTNLYMVSSRLLMPGTVILLLTYRLWVFLRLSLTPPSSSTNRIQSLNLLLYVDDIVLTALSPTLLRQLLTALQASFPMKDFGLLQHFLGITVTRSPSGMMLSQQQYALDLLERTSMTACKLCSTPVDTQTKLSTSGDTMADPTLYRSLVGALQYLTFSRPNITYAYTFISERASPYCGQAHSSLPVGHHRSQTLSWLHRSFSSHIYTNADWPSCPNTCRSTSGYVVFLGDNLIFWSSKCQPNVSRSSAEAEYLTIANGVAEASWLLQLLQELHHPPQHTTLVYCDNVSDVYLSSDPMQRQRTKHIEIDLHFVRECVAASVVCVLRVPTSSQFADLFTKSLL